MAERRHAGAKPRRRDWCTVRSHWSHCEGQEHLEKLSAAKGMTVDDFKQSILSDALRAAKLELTAGEFVTDITPLVRQLEATFKPQPA
jgi:hypothetical protein